MASGTKHERNASRGDLPFAVSLRRPAAIATACIALSVAAMAWATTTAVGPPSPGSPIELRGTAGGSDRATRLGSTAWGMCRGWIPREPQHEITLTRDASSMQLAVRAPSDTTLVVRGPDGLRCQDDANGFDPAIAGAWSSGVYQVWVGAYEEGAAVDYVLTVSAR